jgi:hypothetical protein
MDRSLRSAMQNIGQLPLGVAILAILVGLFGFFVVILGLAFLFVAAGFLLSGLGISSVFGYTGATAGVIILIVGLIILGAAVGLWNQRLWALVLAILVLLVYGALELVSSAWLGLIVVAVLIVYLIAVSSHFD